MKIKNQNTIPSKYLLLIVVVVCGILLGAERFMDGGPLSWVANYTIIPMQKGISYVGTWMSDLTDNFATLKDLQKENERTAGENRYSYHRQYPLKTGAV